MTQDLVERYLMLGLRLGRHVDGLVDAHCGPPELAEAVEQEDVRPAIELATDADELLGGDLDRFRRLLTEPVRVGALRRAADGDAAVSSAS